MQLFNHDLIRSKGKTAYAMAKELGVSDLSIYSIVSGKTVPRLPLARQIAVSLGETLDNLQFVGELLKDKALL